MLLLLLLQNTAFLDLDERFYEAVQDKRRTASGCTLLAALLWGSQLVIANAGDSRAVLCRRGRAMNLSRDHKPSMASEKLRITNLGAHSLASLVAHSCSLLLASQYTLLI